MLVPRPRICPLLTLSRERGGVESSRRAGRRRATANAIMPATRSRLVRVRAQLEQLGAQLRDHARELQVERLERALNRAAHRSGAPPRVAPGWTIRNRVPRSEPPRRGGGLRAARCDLRRPSCAEKPRKPVGLPGRVQPVCPGSSRTSSSGSPSSAAGQAPAAGASRASRSRTERSARSGELDQRQGPSSTRSDLDLGGRAPAPAGGLRPRPPGVESRRTRARHRPADSAARARDTERPKTAALPEVGAARPRSMRRVLVLPGAVGAQQPGWTVSRPEAEGGRRPTATMSP